MLVFALLVGGTARAFAGTTGGVEMPWNAPLQSVVDNLSGPTGHALVLIAIMLSGIIWAFTRHEEGGKKIGQIAVGGSLILGAASLMTSMGFVGAVI
jgi:type IV secretion system protein VirB2